MPYAMVDGCRIAYDREGSGPPVLFLHGAAQDGTVWREVVGGFTGGYDVIVMDHPGHGKSALWQGEPMADVSVFAHVVGRFLQELGVGPAALVAHSLSGAVALRAALDVPELVSAVVNIAGSARSAEAAIGYPGDLLDLVQVNPTDWMVTNFRSLIGTQLSEERRWELAYDSKRVPPEVIMGDLHAYTSCTFYEELGGVSVPVLNVAGEHDWSCSPERVRSTAQALGGPHELVVFDGVGHLPQLEVPEQLTPLIRAFFARIGHVAEESR